MAGTDHKRVQGNRESGQAEELVGLQMWAAPKTGMVVSAAINSIGDKLGAIDVPAVRVGIGLAADGSPFLHYRIAPSDRKDWLSVHAKMSSYVSSLSIFSFGHFWLDDRIYCSGELVWERPKIVRVVVEKEGSPVSPDILDGKYCAGMVDINYHVATHYPQVWLYHDIALFLLRGSYPGLDFNAEILLNFFKIGEIVTASLFGVNPELRDIQRACDQLGVAGFTEDEIRGFYVARARDAAHDWMQAIPIRRETAVDCKLWAESMVVRDWMHRGVEIVRRGSRRMLPRRNLADPPFEWERRGRRHREKKEKAGGSV